MLSEGNKAYQKDVTLLNNPRVTRSVLDTLTETIFCYTAYPTSVQIMNVVEMLIEKYPCLTERTHAFTESSRSHLADNRPPPPSETHITGAGGAHADWMFLPDSGAFRRTYALLLSIIVPSVLSVREMARPGEWMSACQSITDCDCLFLYAFVLYPCLISVWLCVFCFNN